MTTLRALECVVAVIERGSVTEAAAALHLSQPALSHQLATLEREIGTPLVERLPRGVRPTAAGRAVLAAADRVVATGRAVADGAGGRLRLACAETMTAGLLAPVLRRWRRRRPAVHVELIESTSADALLAVLDEGRADIAVGPRGSRADDREVLLGGEEVVVVLPPGVTFDGPVPWTDLAGLPLVGYHPTNGLAAWLDAAAAEHGVALEPGTRTRHAVTAAQLAHAGLGAALVPTTALPARHGFDVHPLDPPLVRDVVAWVATPSDPMVRTFLTDLRRRGVPRGSTASGRPDSGRAGDRPLADDERRPSDSAP